MKAQINKDERIEFRISPEDKKMFQRAQRLSGSRTFSGFVTRTVRAKSVEIIGENERILASQRDKEIFFKAILADIEPNKVLTEAAERFKSTQK
ncbi:MAG: DUF1778 domain-containing protein [Flavobacteriales bacterium]|nr:DUF1778 domain-containing protein [Flavobacteriales bacterium]